MDQVPEDFFYDNISGNNFLKQIFKVTSILVIVIILSTNILLGLF